MPNPLTGDFDAVVQISSAMLQRLLATMHQNGGPGQEALPKLLHQLSVRIGESPDGPVDGVRGTLRAQVAVPVAELPPSGALVPDGPPIKLFVEFWVRAQYVADPDTAPLPEWLHGRLRAGFVLELIAADGVPRIQVTASDDDADIAFIPAEGSAIGAAEAEGVNVQVRRVLRMPRFSPSAWPVPPQPTGSQLMLTLETISREPGDGSGGARAAHTRA